MKITFKKQPRETGLSAVGRPYPDVHVKVDKKRVGILHAPIYSTKDRKWGIQIAVEVRKHVNCSWSWTSCQQRFDNEEKAREGAKLFIEQIVKSGLELHYFED
jgi:hypothetical protein